MHADDEIKELAAKLAAILEQETANEIHIFTKQEVADLQRVLVFVRRLDAFAWGGKWLFLAVVTGGTLIANWDRIKDFFR